MKLPKRLILMERDTVVSLKIEKIPKNNRLASELRTKWRSIRDRYIRERRLYKESLQEGTPKFPKWQLYPEFAFLDIYVEQGAPRTYQTLENNNDNESVHSEGHQEEDGNDFNMLNEGNDNEEADQSSPSSSSSTPSTSNGPSQPNISVLQLLQRIMQNAESQQKWSDNSLSNIFNHQPSSNSSLDTNSTIMSKF